MVLTWTVIFVISTAEYSKGWTLLSFFPTSLSFSFCFSESFYSCSPSEYFSCSTTFHFSCPFCLSVAVSSSPVPHYFTFILCCATAAPFSSFCFIVPRRWLLVPCYKSEYSFLYLLQLTFFALYFLVSSIGLSQCDSKSMIPEDLCYPECYLAPLQLESKKKDDADDHYIFPAENAQVSYSWICFQVWDVCSYIWSWKLLCMVHNRRAQRVM